MSFQSAFLHIERGASAAAARHSEHVLRPHGYQIDKQVPQKCREGPCTTFQSRARLYMGAVSMAKPRRRDVMAKKSTRRVMNRQKCDARSCSSSARPRGDRFSACRLIGNVVHIFNHVYCTRRCAALRGKARRWGATERAESSKNTSNNKK